MHERTTVTNILCLIYLVYTIAEYGKSFTNRNATVLFIIPTEAGKDNSDKKKNTNILDIAWGISTIDHKIALKYRKQG